MSTDDSEPPGCPLPALAIIDTTFLRNLFAMACNSGTDNDFPGEKITPALSLSAGVELFVSKIDTVHFNHKIDLISSFDYEFTYNYGLFLLRI